ncbi:MAG: hypothetical protein ACXWQO_18420, partial [Bdellovibrionota bacterium]
ECAVRWEDMRSELVMFKGEVGVRVWTEGTEELEVRSRGVKLFLHPGFSYNKEGRLTQLVFFPSSINKIMASEGAELVIVPEWGLNTIFGGFNSSTHYYQTNLWELDNNDTLRFAQLLAKKQIPFLGTHDLTAHMSGVKAAEIQKLSILGKETAEVLSEYFGQLRGEAKSRASLIIPYLMGVLLDDLAQPANYGSKRHLKVLAELAKALRLNFIDPKARMRIFRFPETFGSLIEFTRFSSDETVADQAGAQVQRLASDILAGALRVG